MNPIMSMKYVCREYRLVTLVVSHNSHPQDGTPLLSDCHLSANDTLLRDAQVQPFGQLELDLCRIHCTVVLVLSHIQAELVKRSCGWSCRGEITKFPDIKCKPFSRTI